MGRGEQFLGAVGFYRCSSTFALAIVIGQHLLVYAKKSGRVDSARKDAAFFVSFKGSRDSAISMYDVFAASPPQRFVDLRSRSDQCLGGLFLISAG